MTSSISYRQLFACLAAFHLLCQGLALNCYQCGQYNEGVGSITPCLNATVQLHVKKCPEPQMQYCIKYVTELSTVRDCVSTCVEKESWGSRTYCCATDECNSAQDLRSNDVVVFLAAVMLSQLTAGLVIFN